MNISRREFIKILTVSVLAATLPPIKNGECHAENFELCFPFEFPQGFERNGAEYKRIYMPLIYQD